MIRNQLLGAAAFLCLSGLTACSESAPEIIELTYRDRCPASDTLVSLISMDDLARLSGAKLLNPETGSAPTLIRVNAPASLPDGQGIRLNTAIRQGNEAITTFVASEEKNAKGNACSVLTIAPDADGFEALTAMFNGEPIGSVRLVASAVD